MVEVGILSDKMALQFKIIYKYKVTVLSEAFTKVTKVIAFDVLR